VVLSPAGLRAYQCEVPDVNFPRCKVDAPYSRICENVSTPILRIDRGLFGTGGKVGMPRAVGTRSTNSGARSRLFATAKISMVAAAVWDEASLLAQT
jgi:hypothetical protein